MFQKIRKALKPKVTFRQICSGAHPNSGSKMTTTGAEETSWTLANAGDTKMIGVYGTELRQQHSGLCSTVGTSAIVVFVCCYLPF